MRKAPPKKPKNIMDVDVEDALPALTSAFSSISGDKFERLTKKLLIDHKNISVVCEATDGEVKLLNYDLANEVFCGDVQDLYILCFEVIGLNFKGFFQENRSPIWKPKGASSETGSEYQKWGDLDLTQFTELEMRMYILIKARIASKLELETVYTLDEALKLYALYCMDMDIERGEGGGVEAAGSSEISERGDGG